MADIYLVGHGSWDTKGRAKPFVPVPKDTEVIFYTPVGRFINSDQTADIITGAASKLPPDHIVGPNKSCTNLTLSHGLFAEEERALLTSGVRYVQASTDMSMEEILERYSGNRLHWLACRVRLGARDFDHGGTNQDYRPDQGIGTGANVPTLSSPVNPAKTFK